LLFCFIFSLCSGVKTALILFFNSLSIAFIFLSFVQQ
jgi:hypothetical protein